MFLMNKLFVNALSKAENVLFIKKGIVGDGDK